MKLDSAAGLRRMLTADRLLEEIIDFGDSQLFGVATNYTAILILANGGQDDIRYRRLNGSRTEIRRALARASGDEAHYLTADLGRGPWVLATGAERSLLDGLRRDAEALGEVSAGIFTGLQTSADAIYIVEDRGWRGPNRCVWSRASERLVELEPALLHPLASGADVDRYAFRPATQFLLFPYRRDGGGAMRLLPWDEIAPLPKTAAYLGEHEATLRGRERGRMDHEGWYGYNYPKSLGLHDLPKLGVPRMCAALRASVDPAGETYLDNVDVNGVLPRDGGPSLWTLAVLLNSDALNFVFRRSSVPFRGAYLSANKQFIAPLPIRVPDAGSARELDALGQRLQRGAGAIGAERAGFLAWLEDLAGARVRDLAGWTALASFEVRPLAELVDVLVRNAARLRVDPASRAIHDALAEAHEAGRVAIGELALALARDRREAEERVADLYGLTTAQRALVAEDARPSR